MGDISQIASMLPGGMGRQLEGAELDPKVLNRSEAIILSMTPYERENPNVLDASRKRRIAAGCGLEVSDVNRLLKQYDMMNQIAKQMYKGRGKLGAHGRPRRRQQHGRQLRRWFAQVSAVKKRLR